MGEVLRGQLNANPENEILLKQALPIIDALEHRRRVDITNIHPALQSIFNPAVQGFLINAFSYNPGHLISSISKPVLVLQGQRDLRWKKRMQDCLRPRILKRPRYTAQYEPCYERGDFGRSQSEYRVIR